MSRRRKGCQITLDTTPGSKGRSSKGGALRANSKGENRRQSWEEFIETWAKLPPPLSDWTDVVKRHAREHGIALFAKLAQNPENVADDPTLEQLKRTVAWMVLNTVDTAVKRHRRASAGVSSVKRALENELECILEGRRASELRRQKVQRGQRRGVRKPDLETSQRRVRLYEQLSAELSKVQQWRQKNRRALSLSALEQEYPDFALWHHLTATQQRDRPLRTGDTSSRNCWRHSRFPRSQANSTGQSAA
jgi:hypothetical protein